LSHVVASALCEATFSLAAKSYDWNPVPLREIASVVVPWALRLKQCHSVYEADIESLSVNTPCILRKGRSNSIANHQQYKSYSDKHFIISHSRSHDHIYYRKFM
jgi:hypothetical protein